MRSLLRVSVLALLMGLFGATWASAGIVTNGSFETTGGSGVIPGWTKLGPFGGIYTGIPVVPPSTIVPTQGLRMATVVNQGFVTDSTIESSLGLSAGSLDSLSASLGGGDTTLGSVFYQTITIQSAGANLGEKINFDLDPATTFVGGTPDVVFWGVVPVGGPSLTYLTGGLTTSATLPVTNHPSALGITRHTGFQNYSTPVLAAGTYRLFFGVIDNVSTSGDSYLFVDNITFTSAVVPEPSTMLLGGLGILGLGWVARQRTRRSARKG